MRKTVKTSLVVDKNGPCMIQQVWMALDLMRSRKSLLIFVCCFLLQACSDSNTVPFEIIAQEESAISGGKTPVLLAVQGDAAEQSIPNELPAKARESLRQILIKKESALYIVVFDGPKPSTGYKVRINSITKQRENNGEHLVVNYSVDKPALGGGATITYPFVIAQVKISIPASAVRFEGPSHPTPASIALSYDIVAYGAPTTGSGDSPITLGIRGSEGKQNLPDSLPEQAKQILQKIFEQADSNLYIVIYAGRYPGTDYKVGIDFIEERREGGKEQLVVRYRIDKPLSTTSTPSYPFLIVRIKTNIQTGNIIFEHQ
jgi:hypothetical protein